MKASLADSRVGLLCAAAVLSSSTAALSTSANGVAVSRQPPKQVTAVRASGTIVLDGQLDDDAWQLAQAAGNFVQQEPAEGMPATRQTSVRFAYDGDTLYVGAILYDEQPERAITDELTRDFNERSGDLFGIVLDTFQDGRSSYGFLTNPSGAQREVQAFDNGQKSDANWNGAWFVQTRLQADAWTVEAAIPFKTLRFPDRAEQRWGVNIVRIVRRTNEVSMWSPVPRPLSHYHVGYAGVLTGVQGVRPGRHLRITPFTTARTGRSRSEDPWAHEADGGVDLKWAVTPSFVLDGTFRTDFAQVEADEQQINLTRFSQLFPEKRQFFLEAPNSFQIGLATEETGAVATALIPFFTRRIGLSENGEPIPVLGGARLTGQSGGTTVGLLNMQTSSHAGRSGDNFTAARLARQVGEGVTVGTFYFGREASGSGPPAFGAYNRVMGGDVRFSPSRVFDVEALVMRAVSDGPEDDGVRRVRARLRGNTSRATFDYLHIGDDFRHDLGFVRRRGIAMFYGDYSKVFRPRSTQRWAREHTLQAESQTLLNTGYDHVLTNQDRAIYAIGLADGGAFRIIFEHNFERADQPFSLRGVPVGAGIYEFNELVMSYSTDRSRRLSASVQRNHGDFWDGTRRRIKSNVRLRLTAHLAASLDYQREAITVGTGGFIAELAAVRADWSLSTRMFLNALVQYDGTAKGWLSNVRFNFIHRPLSDIYVVWNEGRSPSTGETRALVLKYTHLVEF